MFKLGIITEERTFLLHPCKPETKHVLLYPDNTKFFYILLFIVVKQLRSEVLQLCCTVCKLDIMTGFGASVGCEDTVLECTT